MRKKPAAFASKLLTGMKKLNHCTLLEEEQYKENLKSVTELVELIDSETGE